MLRSIVIVGMLLVFTVFDGLSRVYAQEPVARLRITWDHDGTNADGTPADDMGEFRLFFDTKPIPDESGAKSLTPLMSFPPSHRSGDLELQAQPDWKTLHFRMDVCDTSGNCSDYSNEAQYVMPDTMPPSNFQITIEVLPPAP